MPSNSSMLPKVIHELEEEKYSDTLREIRNIKIDSSFESSTILHIEGNGNYRDFVSMAKRGIYSYDKLPPMGVTITQSTLS